MAPGSSTGGGMGPVTKKNLNTCFNSCWALRIKTQWCIPSLGLVADVSDLDKRACICHDGGQQNGARKLRWRWHGPSHIEAPHTEWPYFACPSHNSKHAWLQRHPDLQQHTSSPQIIVTNLFWVTYQALFLPVEHQFLRRLRQKKNS